jgi:hypothetical protein
MTFIVNSSNIICCKYTFAFLYTWNEFYDDTKCYSNAQYENIYILFTYKIINVNSEYDINYYSCQWAISIIQYSSFKVDTHSVQVWKRECYSCENVHSIFL